MLSTAMTIQDVITLVMNLKNAKMIDIDPFLPFFILPVLFLVASISFVITIIIMVVICMGALYIQLRPQQKNKSPFFLSWTIASWLYMFLVFWLKIIIVCIITKLEYFIFMVLMICTGLLFHKMKQVAEFEVPTKGKEYSPVLTADSHYCQICQIEVNERLFHSIWWNCCVLRSNYKYFLAGHIFAFATLFHGISVGLTTVCRSYNVYYGFVIIPLRTDDIYWDFDTAFSFVACVYAVGYLLVIALVLIRQLIFYLPKYCDFKWRKILNV